MHAGNAIFDRIYESVLNAFKIVSSKETNYRKKYDAECDVVYAVFIVFWIKV